MKKHIIPNDIGDFIKYDPETGLLHRAASAIIGRGRRCLGPIKNKDTRDSIQFMFRGVRYLGHRVAWFLITGEQPDIVDHISGDRHDNRFINLRSVTTSENGQNQKRHRNGSTPGVSFDKRHDLWRVRMPGEQMKHVGYFKSEIKAVRSLKKAIKELKKSKRAVAL